MKKQGLAGSILSYATPCKGKLIISVICALLSVAGGIIPYVAAYRIICLFFNQTATAETILYWTIVGTIGFLGKVLFHAISTTLSHISAYTILELMRKRVAEKLMKAPLGVAQGINAGRVKNIVVDQIENIEIPLAHVIPEGAGALVLPIAVFSYLCMIDFRLALASLITIPLALIPYGMMLGGYNKTYQVYMEANEHMNNVVVEYMEGIEVVKAFNQSTSSYEKYRKAVENFKQTTLNWYKSTWKFTTLGASILPTTLLGVLPIGTLLYLYGSTTLPTFDEAKRLMANGKVATCVCSSWAISQFQEAAADAGVSEDVIGYMPFPTPTADMKQLVRLGRDYVNGVSVHSKHQDIALAWVKFFAETDYSTRLASSVSPLVGSELPEIAVDWYDLGVEFAACTAAQGEDQGLLDKIDKESEVGLLDATFKQRIIDAAIGNRDETYDDIMNDLNSSWVAAMDTLGVQ